MTQNNIIHYINFKVQQYALNDLAPPKAPGVYVDGVFEQNVFE